MVNNEKLEKQDCGRTDGQRKILFEMNTKTKLCSTKTFQKDLVGIHKIKPTLTLTKPAYVRTYILELSKVLMYEFHFDYIKNKYVKKSNL